jgi:hypothetical protein
MGNKAVIPTSYDFYGMLKIPAEYDRDTTSSKFKDICHKLPASPLDVSAANQRALVDESGVIRTQMGKHNRSENGCTHGTLCTIPPHNSNQY